MSSFSRKIDRARTRNANSLELVLGAKVAPKTASPRMAVAGNTGTRYVRKARAALAQYRRSPEQQEKREKAIEHRNGHTQLIKYVGGPELPNLHQMALYIARKLNTAEKV